MVSEICFEDVRGLHLLVALSGGADSVALLHLLHQQRNRLSLHLTAAHLNHGIRGPEAEQDAAFCRSLCRSLGVGLIEETADVPALARGQGLGLETAAREARYRFLHRAREQSGADLIALAHHMDDQAETVLMHLLRGAGMAGACGMQRRSGVLYRPLLEVRKAALREYLANAGIGWQEDASNGLADNPRNALRLHVLPEIEKSYPHAVEALARHARILQVDSACLEAMTDRFLLEHLERGPWGLRLRMDAMPEEAVLRRAFRRICAGELSAQKTRALIDLTAKERGKEDISSVLLAEKTPSALYFLRKDVSLPEALALNLPGETVLSGVCRITAEIGNFEIERDNPDVEVLDANALAGAVLRTRRSGDRMRPLGSSGHRLLSDILTDRKIDRPLRDFMPLIAVGNNVLWTGYAGISEDARIYSTTTRRVRIRQYNFTDE